MPQQQQTAINEDQRKEIIKELNDLLIGMARNAPTSPAEGASNEKVKTVISKILGMVESEEEKQRREQSSQSSKGGV